MKISINGIAYEIAEGSSIMQALILSSPNSVTQIELKGFVIALNKTFISRSQYPLTKLQDNDAIELLSPMAGG
mgnify:CR=1 FL=1